MANLTKVVDPTKEANQGSPQLLSSCVFLEDARIFCFVLVFVVGVLLYYFTFLLPAIIILNLVFLLVKLK